jgi:hypothetical protein
MSRFNSDMGGIGSRQRCDPREKSLLNCAVFIVILSPVSHHPFFHRNCTTVQKPPSGLTNSYAPKQAGTIRSDTPR